MSRKWTILWFTLIFALFLAVSIHAFRKTNLLLLIISEITIPVLYIITVTLYLRSFRAVMSIRSSLSLLREGDFSSTLVKTGNSEVDDMISVYNSMITRLREERLSVREKNQFLDLLIESSPLGIVITDLDEKITHINSTAYRYLGLSPGDYTGRFLPDIKCRLSPWLGKTEYDQKQLIVLTDSHKYLCRKLYFMDRGFRHPFYLIEEFTEELRKAEKEAYSKVIRMMAHEVNNTIGSVNSIISTIRSGSDSFKEDEREEIIRILDVAINRNYQMNRFMQNFANVVRLPSAEKAPMDLCESVTTVLDSFRTIINGKQISLITRFPETLPVISADRSQMEQVFVNIIKNSIEAIDGDGEIIVTIKSDPLCITFEDNGKGISENDSEPLFTPFFSTKPGGQGIGLTLVREILLNHGFTFYLCNRDPKGAEFGIKF